jgi:cobyrinic acid a,c-diamide synthase
MKVLLVAGTHSGCGKTSVALGLMAALRGKGLRVQPFKVGPDFIDPGLHELAAGRPSHNLDGWMLPRSTVEDIFARYAADADVAVVEGVMGLFDGFSATSEEGSSAEIAKWLGLPVLLVVDARAMARSAAAMVKGYAEFDAGLPFAGAVMNRVGSEHHGKALADAVEAAGFACLGLLPRREEITLPSRHLGLTTARDLPDGEARIQELGTWLAQHMDLDGLLARLPDASPATPADPPLPTHRARIGVARDAAFCFYYGENLRLLEQAGAELVFFSPMADKDLPPDLGGLYLGGGYPELNAPDLAQNAGLRRQIAAFCASGRPVLAECGGFMYLMESLTTVNGQIFPMAGVYPFRAVMNERRAALGYRQVTTSQDSLLGPAGTLARGHEFHYSRLEDADYDQAELYLVEDRRGRSDRPEGFVRDGVLGSYIHLHFGSGPHLAANFVSACARQN